MRIGCHRYVTGRFTRHSASRVGRFIRRSAQDHRRRRDTPYALRGPEHGLDPVVLVPGFMADDSTRGLISRRLRRLGYGPTAR